MDTINQPCWAHNSIRPLICRRIHFHKIWYWWFSGKNVETFKFSSISDKYNTALYADLPSSYTSIFCACQRMHSSSTHARPLNIPYYFSTWPQSQWPRSLRRGLRPLACWDCGFESRRGHGCLSLESVVCSDRGICDNLSRGVLSSVVSGCNRGI